LKASSFGFLAGVFLLVSAWGQENKQDLFDLSIEDLMNVEVTSVSKTEQKLSRTASAVFVITQEDIRRSGSTNIPDLLRMVPGVNVAQINANTWAISARGFNAQFSNELLVLLDGRPVYTPTFGGVFWDVLDVPMEDIERIEVIRGPGGSVWGANAVNGVIDIITKKAADTRGGLVVAGGGNSDQGFGTAQYGGALGQNIDYRVYAKDLNQDHMPSFTGQNGADGWHMFESGFRIDSTLSHKDTLTVQGSFYDGREGDPTTVFPSVTSPAPSKINSQVDTSGGFVQSIWNRVDSSGSDTTLQVSYSRYKRDDVLMEERNMLDVDFQHHFALGKRQDIVWGLGFLYSTSATDGDLTFSLNPSSLNTQLFSSFIQDEITVVPDRLYLTVGTKLEHNYYTGFGLWPSVRMAWKLNEHHMLWTAVSRAARTPSSVDTAERISVAGYPGPDGVPVLVMLVGNPRYKDEGLIAYEMGYRAAVFQRLSIDLAAYYNYYDNQETVQLATPYVVTTPGPPHLVVPLTLQNGERGETHGVEIAGNWKATNRWTLSPGYSFEQIHMYTSAAIQDTQSNVLVEGSDPRHSAQLRSTFALGPRLAWDLSAYFVDRLPYLRVPAYTRLDTELSWKWSEQISLGLVGQNLLTDHHVEFFDTTGATLSTLIKRSVYAKIAWRF
jgi:iron complex outermembrane receptor protein